jgi:hypothetical protein
VQRLLRDGGVSDAEVVAENGFQSLRSAEDWWIIALGSGLRWVIDQMGQQVAARVKADNVNWLSENKSIASRSTPFMQLEISSPNK